MELDFVHTLVILIQSLSQNTSVILLISMYLVSIDAKCMLNKCYYDLQLVVESLFLFVLQSHSNKIYSQQF